MLSGCMEGTMLGHLRQTNMRVLIGLAGGLLFLALALRPGNMLGQSPLPAPKPPEQTAGQRDLSQISIEDLMNIKVTSVSKKEQKMSLAAAAIFVITQEDIHRSAATNIPDLLRMV